MKSPRASRIAAPALLIAALAATVAAHDTWIGPPLAPVAAGATVRLDLTSGGAFPALDHAPESARVARADVRLAGKVMPLKTPRRRRHGLEFVARLAAPGVAAVAVSLKPKQLELSADKIQEYLEEIDAVETAGAIWEKRPAPKRWLETYTKHARTFVRVGDPRGDASWAQPSGLQLEIVPEKDPTALAPGDSLPVRVLKNGAPMAGFALEARHGPATPRQRARTDADGRAVFILAEPGPWLIAGTDLRPAADGATWESDFTTLAIRVAPRQAVSH